MELTLLRPNPFLLAGAVVLDLAIGDPVYPLHPIRLMGATLSWLESRLRRLGADGYGGGIDLLLAAERHLGRRQQRGFVRSSKIEPHCSIGLPSFPGIFMPRTPRSGAACMGS